jgi:ketosteroid isomerase-like protein
MTEAPSDVERAVRSFVAAINAHDPGAIMARCPSGHVFVDSLGNRLTGAGQLQRGWEWYFATFPDYRIEIDAVAMTSDCVLLSGSASGTHAGTGTPWSIPAAWKAKVAGAHITHWQVYADNKPVYEILGRGAG